MLTGLIPQLDHAMIHMCAHEGVLGDVKACIAMELCLPCSQLNTLGTLTHIAGRKQPHPSGKWDPRPVPQRMTICGESLLPDQRLLLPNTRSQNSKKPQKTAS